MSIEAQTSYGWGLIKKSPTVVPVHFHIMLGARRHQPTLECETVKILHVALPDMTVVTTEFITPDHETVVLVSSVILIGPEINRAKISSRGLVPGSKTTYRYIED